MKYLKKGSRSKKSSNRNSRSGNKENKFLSLINGNADGVLIVDPSGIILFSNPAAEFLFGRPKSELVGSPFGFPSQLTSEIQILRNSIPIPVDVRSSAIEWEGKSCSLLSLRDMSGNRKLEEMKSLLGAIVSFSADAIFSRNLEGVILSWNRGAEKIFGYSPAEILGRNHSTLVPANKRPELNEFMKRVFSGESIISLETERIRKDGSALPVSLTVSPIYSEQSVVVGASILARDITELKHAQEAFIESQTRFLRITDAIPGAVYQYKLKADGSQCFNFMSAGAFDLFGYTSNEIQKNYDLVWGQILPEDQKRLALSIQKSYETLQPWIDEFRIKKDGRIKWIRGNSIPEKLQPDKSLVWNGLLTDVTQIKISHQQLFVSESMNRGILEASFDCIIAMDAEGNVLEWNPAAEKTFGYTKEYALSHKLEELIIPPKFRERHKAGLRRFLETGSSKIIGQRVELSALKADGSEFPVELAITEIVGGDESAVIFTAYLRDITERKRIELELMKSADRYQALVLASAQLVWTASPEGLIVEDSSSWRNFTGQTFEEYVGWGWLSVIHPDDRARVQKTWELSAVTHAVYQTEYRLRKHDGTYRHYIVTAIPVYEQDGKLREWVGFCIDVSELKKVETDLRLSIERFDLAVRGSNDGIWDWTMSDNFVFYSDRFKELLGFKDSEMKNHLDEFFIRLHPEDVSRVEKALSEHHEKKVPYNIEYRLRHKDGSYRWFHARGQSIWNEDGKAIRMSGSLSDITERKETEQQLLQAQKMETIGTLAGGIAHDLNNQLTPIVGYLDISLSQIDTQNPLYGYLSTAQLSTQRCKEIIQRLMNFSRPSKQAKRVIYLKASFDELKSFFVKLLPSNIKIEFDAEDMLWPIFANETELQSVFMNFAANARDAMPDGGIIKIKLKNLSAETAGLNRFLRSEPYVHIYFSDSGIGMPPQILNRIFEPFFTTKPMGEGTGLGLAMVFKIVHDHGGYVSAESHEGQGTEFHIYFPAQPDAEAQKGDEKRQKLNSIVSGGGLALFADDEEPILSLGTLFLKHLGFQVLSAKDGEELISLYRDNKDRITVVLTDLTMPKLSGKQIVSKLLSINPDVKIILASGYTSDGIADDFLKMGAKAFIQKPYNIEIFAKTLIEVLNLKNQP